MQIETTPAMLKAALTHAANQDVRYYLNGVLIEATATETRAIATDGHRCCVIRAAVANVGVVGKHSFIVPREAIEAMKVSAPAMRTTASLTSDDGKEWRVTAPGCALFFKPIAGVFPNYRCIVPQTLNGEIAQYNPKFLLDVFKAGKILDPKLKEQHVIVQHNGGGAAVATTGNADFFAVIMPQVWYDKKGQPIPPTDHLWVKD